MKWFNKHLKISDIPYILAISVFAAVYCVSVFAKATH